MRTTARIPNQETVATLDRSEAGEDVYRAKNTDDLFNQLKLKKEIAALEAMPDSAIDCSDIPELTEDELENAVRGRFYRPVNKED